MYPQKCRHFNGYKPCNKNTVCDHQCAHLDVPQSSILIVHLGAMGAVLRSTALLSMIKRKFPSSYITWVTEDHTKPLLENNPYIDKVLGISARDQLMLSAMDFDIGFFIDKSPEVGGLRKLANPDLCFGFSVEPSTSAIIPVHSSSVELWEIGLNNHKKFFENKKTELQLLAEALCLPYRRDEYLVRLTEQEEVIAAERAQEWSNQGRRIVVGLNTGTSGVLPNKTIPIEIWRRLIQDYVGNNVVQFVLLGGASDGHRNVMIGEGFQVIQSPTHLGLRDGLCSVKAVDIVVTGDSLGMHMAIALKKQVVAWFGPSCAHEIDLYDRGFKIETSLSCSPCWKRQCSEKAICNQTIETTQFKTALDFLLNNIQCQQNENTSNQRYDSAASL